MRPVVSRRAPPPEASTARRLSSNNGHEYLTCSIVLTQFWVFASFFLSPDQQTAKVGAVIEVLTLADDQLIKYM